VQAHIQFHGSGNLKDVMNFALPSYLCDNLKKKKYMLTQMHSFL